MKTLNISEARNTLPALVDLVSVTHAPVVLLRYGKPAAMLVPIPAQQEPPAPYPLRDVPIFFAEDFDAPLSSLWETCGVAEDGKAYGVSKKKQSARSKRKVEKE